MTTQYFEVMGVLFAIYAIVRLSVWWGLRVPARDPDAEQMPCHGIDPARLAERVEQVRHDYETGLAVRPVAFKKPLLVEEKREELAKLPYFRHLIEAQTDKEDGQLSSA